MIELAREGDVFVLRMTNGENRFSPQMLEALEGALTTVADTDGPRALVTTGTGKFFTNGLDLEWLGAHPTDVDWYLGRVNHLMARYLSMPCATVAACNGHTYGAGAMLALAHDHQIMRVDRGFWCLPEVNLGMTFPSGLNELVIARLPVLTAHEAMVTGRQYGGIDAAAAGIVDRTATEDAVVPDAVALAQSLAGKAGASIATIRTTIHASVLAALEAPVTVPGPAGTVGI